MRGDRRTGTRGRDHQRRAAAARPSTSRSTTSAPRRFPTTPPTPRKHIYNVNIPGCATPGKLFVGQRKDPFAVNLGAIFDLVNVAERGASLLDNTNKDAGADDLADKNITTLALEVPTSCLLASAANR